METASSSHTLFKSRRHNDSVKRFKNKSTGIQPQSAGPYTLSQVFFDPKNELCGDSLSVRKEMGDLCLSLTLKLLEYFNIIR